MYTSPILSFLKCSQFSDTICIVLSLFSSHNKITHIFWVIFSQKIVSPAYILFGFSQEQDAANLCAKLDANVFDKKIKKNKKN